VQLVVSPTSLTSGQPITIKTGTHLALKVEGVIEHSGKKIFRSPTSVNIIVTPKVNELADSLIKMPQLSDLQLTPPIVNDYFVGEFLLTLPRVGTYVVAIETNLVDGESKIWHTGPQIETNVKVESDDDIKPASTTTNNIKGPTNTTTATTSGTTNGNSTW
jgi:integrator complex subunit 7